MRHRIRALQEQVEREEEQLVLSSSVKRAKDAFTVTEKAELSLEDLASDLFDTYF